MLGISQTMHDQVMEWTDAIAVILGTPNRTLDQIQVAQNAILNLTEFFREAVAERRKQRGQDLISLLLDIEEDGEVLTEEELYAQCVLLVGAGHETTRNLIGNGIYTLLRHPETMAELRENPQNIRLAVEELLRYESPVQYTHRIAKEEMEICGLRLRQGELVMFLNAAANRDPHQFKDPDRLDLKRVNNPHLSFGAGAHFCVGSQLARLEGQVAILKLIQQFPQIRLAQEHAEWVPNFGFRGLKTLPVVF
jgi:cytochrome P450